MNPYSIPFDIPGELTESNGILTLVDEELRMEFQTKDGFIGLVKSDVKRAVIPLSEILDIRFKKSWFGSGKILLQVGNMHLLEKVPGHTSGSVQLKIKKEFRDNAMNLVAEITYTAAEKSLKAIKDQL
jgi:hypothetical protein